MKQIVALVFGLVLWTLPAWSQNQPDTSPGAQTGVQVYGSYFSSDIDTVGLFNGNLSLNIGLISLPGRELSMSLGVSYNSQKWEQQQCGGYTCGVYTDGWNISHNFGGALDMWVKLEACAPEGINFWQKFRVDGYWTDGQGAKHRYTTLQTGNVYSTESECQAGSYSYSNFNGLDIPSADSDGSILKVGNWFTTGTNVAIFFKDGARRELVSTNRVSTPNGNSLTQSASGLPAQDTLGRTIAVATGGTYEHPYATYTIKDSNNVDRVYKLTYLRKSAYNVYSATYNELTLMESIELPNGKSYVFEYNNTRGYLTKVILPSGGYIRYAYALNSNTMDWVGDRVVSSDGTTGSEKLWNYQVDHVYCGCTTVVNPDGTAVVHTFNSKGQETLTTWKTSPTGTILKSVSSNWSETETLPNGQPANPKVNYVNTYLNGSSYGTQKTLTYDAYMNVTVETVANLPGGATILQRDYTYTTISGGQDNFKCVSVETIKGVDPVSGSFVLQGKTEYFYSSVGSMTSARRYKDASNYVTETMTYDSYGNVVSSTDPLSQTTSIDFTDNFTDTSKNGTKYAYPKKVTNPLSQFTTTKYEYNTGLPKEVTDLRGSTTTTVYDLMN